MRYARDLLASKATALEVSLRYASSMESARRIRTQLKELEEAIDLIISYQRKKTLLKGLERVPEPCTTFIPSKAYPVCKICGWPETEHQRGETLHEIPSQEYEYTKDLATWLWENKYKAAAPDWEPLPDLMGVLTQIDNMLAGLLT